MKSNFYPDAASITVEPFTLMAPAVIHSGKQGLSVIPQIAGEIQNGGTDLTEQQTEPQSRDDHVFSAGSNSQSRSQCENHLEHNSDSMTGLEVQMRQMQSRVDTMSLEMRRYMAPPSYDGSRYNSSELN